MRGTSRVTTAFFAMTVAASVWLSAFTAMYCSRDGATAIVWARLAYIGVPLLAPAIYSFTIEMLQIGTKRRLAAFAAWLIAIGFSSAKGSTHLLITRVQHFGWGDYPRYGGLLTGPFLIFFFGFLIAALAEFIVAFPRARGLQRARVRMMLVAFAVAYVGCVDYLPKFGIDVYPFGYIPILAFVIIAATAFRRYDIVAITPSLAAPEIINTMADALFVCDREGRIQLVNATVERVLGFTQEELVGRRIEDLLAVAEDATLTNGMRRRTIRERVPPSR